MDFPQMIKLTRQAMGETQAEFAKRFGTGGNTVSRWESGAYQAPYAAISFVVEFARDQVWLVCAHCHGTGRLVKKDYEPKFKRKEQQ